ncbi:hypothetical protein Tco_0492512 [Tanacetum coccineum]
MIDYSLWEVIENGATLPKTHVVEGVVQPMHITSAEDKAQRRLKVKARSSLMMGIPNEHQLKFNSIKDAKLLLEAVEKRFGENISQEDVNQKLLRSLAPEWNTHAIVWRNKSELETMSMDDLYNNLKVDDVICSFFAGQIHPDDIEEMELRWQMAMLTMKARRFLKNTGRKLIVNTNESIRFDKSKVKCYNSHKMGHFSREWRAPKNQDYKNKESSRRSMLVETPSSTALVSCDGLAGYDWSDQAEEGPNYALMAYSASRTDSEVSNDSTCSKSCLECVNLLKTQNDQLLKDFKKSELMVVGYKEGLKSVEGRLEYFKKNEKKLEKVQAKKDGIQLNVDKLENASKSLNQIIESQIVNNYKKGLGYNTVSPPLTGNFIPPKPDLSFIGLEEFANEPIVETRKSDEMVSDSQEKDMS